MIPGRVAVVTGANKGIGYFIALQLGMSGLFSHVLLACRDPSRALQAVDSIQAQVPSSVTVMTESLTMGDLSSHTQFVSKMESLFGKVDVLVNNAGFAFKGTDPTPFREQTKPTMNTNYHGTLDFTLKMLPLLEKGLDPRIVNVASQSGHLGQVSKDLQRRFASSQLTLDVLNDLVAKFEADVAQGVHKQNGWSNTNYGMSKLALIAATKVLARDHPNILINACCPGYCKTDMTSQKGLRDPADGAKNAVIPSTVDSPGTGQFYSNFEVSSW